MLLQRARFALLAGVVLCCTGVPARAGHGHSAGCAAGCCVAACDSCCAAPTVSCAPAMRTVTVTEYRPSTVEEMRTVYKTVLETEKYTAWKTECVAETRKHTVNYTKIVPTIEERTCTVYKSVPTVEERTITKKVAHCHPVTVMVTKTRDCGHYECREEICGPSFKDRLHKHFHKNSCECECEPVRTKTVKVWVPNIVCEQVPCTRNETTWETVVEKVNVTVCKMVPEVQKTQVTVNKCVTEAKEESYTVMVPKQVSYEATRTISKCVPVQEKVSVCKLVAVTVEKQVPVEAPCCETTSHGKHGRKLFGH